MSNEITNTDDTIDSRDVIERIEDLQDFAAEGLLDEDEQDELNCLTKLNEQMEDNDEWSFGIGLIHEDFFVEYTEELLKDCGELPSEIPWYIEIDWEKTANNIKMDYSIVEFDGATYYYRN